VRLITTRLSLGISTPAIRATDKTPLERLALSLALFVPFVLADHAHDAFAPDDLAVTAHFSD
jgi:hypothetical protein